jgi:hypothetical protein
MADSKPPAWLNKFTIDQDKKADVRDKKLLQHIDTTVKPLADKIDRLAVLAERVPVLEKRVEEQAQEIALLKTRVAAAEAAAKTSGDHQIIEETMQLKKKQEQLERADAAVIETSEGQGPSSKEEVATTMHMEVAEIKSVRVLPSPRRRPTVKRLLVVCSNTAAADRLKAIKQQGFSKVLKDRGPVELREAVIMRELKTNAPSDLRFAFRGGACMVVRGPMWAPYPMWTHAVNPMGREEVQLQNCSAADIKTQADSALQHGTRVPEQVLSRMPARTPSSPARAPAAPAADAPAGSSGSGAGANANTSVDEAPGLDGKRVPEGRGMGEVTPQAKGPRVDP